MRSSRGFHREVERRHAGFPGGRRVTPRRHVRNRNVLYLRLKLQAKGCGWHRHSPLEGHSETIRTEIGNRISLYHNVVFFVKCWEKLRWKIPQFNRSLWMYSLQYVEASCLHLVRRGGCAGLAFLPHCFKTRGGNHRIAASDRRVVETALHGV